MSETVNLTEHDNGIHEVVFHEATRQAVDDYMTIVTSIIEKQLAGAEAKVHLLVDLSESGAPPFAYITQEGRKMLHEHHHDREGIHLKGAFLAKDSTKTVLSLAETFIKMLPIDASFKVFDWTKRHDAEDWLLNDA